MSQLSNILNHDEEPGSEELLRYLQGKATEEERFAIEKQMVDSSFVNEAMEGLQHFRDPEEVKNYVAQLNRQLQKHTNKKVTRRNKRKLKEQNWLTIAILAILLLCVTGYLLIHFLRVKH